MANQPNFVNRGPTVKIVTTLPPVGDVENGELLFLISDSKLYLRVTAGYIKSSAFS